MQTFARWTNFSETTFILPATDAKADYRVRIFTPSFELPFAGHPTLGTCHAWLESGKKARNSTHVVQECDAGLIMVSRMENSFAFKAPVPTRFGPLEQELISEVAEILNIDKKIILDSHWLDNGPAWIGVLLPSAQDVLSLKPNLKSKLLIGAFGFYQSKDGPRYEVRAFFPEDGILVEDPVTGSLNASGAQWLISTGRCSAPYKVSQGLAMKRKGEIRVTTDDEGNVWIGGKAVTMISGFVEI